MAKNGKKKISHMNMDELQAVKTKLESGGHQFSRHYINVMKAIETKSK